VINAEPITKAATTAKTTANVTGQRRRRAGVGDVVGGSVNWEVDMGKGVPGDHQPATLGSSHRGAPVRDAVISGHRGDVDTAWKLLGHRDPAVRAAALGALERLGVLDADTLTSALTDPEPTVRRRACVLAGRAVGSGDDRAGNKSTSDKGAGDKSAVDQRAGDPHLIDALVRVLSTDQSDSVVESSAWALGEAGSGCGESAVEALEHVASAHADPLCREAAVAALGAIGDPAALDTVLVALEDKPAVRRRAIIALAAFEDPRVDAAWRRGLEDRDWQVRQAAEDLLGRL
jgi:HEAT repeat protein